MGADADEHALRAAELRRCVARLGSRPVATPPVVGTFAAAGAARPCRCPRRARLRRARPRAEPGARAGPAEACAGAARSGAAQSRVASTALRIRPIVGGAGWLPCAANAAGDPPRAARPADLRHLLRFAFMASGALFARRLRELGKPPDWTYETVFAALIGGLVGSRVDYLIQNWDEVSGDLLGNIFSGSGLVFFGGLVGGALGVVLWARWRGWLGWGLLDTAAASDRDRLRGGPDRLPALGRRRLRRAVGPAVGDGLPRRHRADDREVHPRRSTRRRDGSRRARPVAPARPLRARGPVRALSDPRRARALPRRVHPPQRRGRGGPDARLSCSASR